MHPLLASNLRGAIHAFLLCISLASFPPNDRRHVAFSDQAPGALCVKKKRPLVPERHVLPVFSVGIATSIVSRCQPMANHSCSARTYRLSCEDASLFEPLIAAQPRPLYDADESRRAQSLGNSSRTAAAHKIYKSRGAVDHRTSRGESDRAAVDLSFTLR